VREGVAFALQHIGKQNFVMLMEGISNWIEGSEYEKRAVVAGLCEPRLLTDKRNAATVLAILNTIMESVESISNRKKESFRVLKKGLGYGLSVAVVANPAVGKNIFENLSRKSDTDIRWILRENLKKKRLERMDENWTMQMINACT